MKKDKRLKIGTKNNELTIIGYAEKQGKWRGYKLVCKCSCGGQAICYTNEFTRGYVKSCGHLKKRYDDVPTGKPDKLFCEKLVLDERQKHMIKMTNMFNRLMCA